MKYACADTPPAFNQERIMHVFMHSCYMVIIVTIQFGCLPTLRWLPWKQQAQESPVTQFVQDLCSPHVSYNVQPTCTLHDITKGVMPNELFHSSVHSWHGFSMSAAAVKGSRLIEGILVATNIQTLKGSSKLPMATLLAICNTTCTHEILCSL